MVCGVCCLLGRVWMYLRIWVRLVGENSVSISVSVRFIWCVLMLCECRKLVR